MYQGSVANNADPLNQARVTMLIPQILGSAESAWASPSSPTNTVPPVGGTLWVQFSGGDITQPVYSPLGIKNVQDQLGGLGLITHEPPKQPTSLALTTSPYTTAEGITQARVQASWVAPTENQDGTPLTDLSHYLLQSSYDGTTWVGGTVTEDTLVIIDGLHTGVDVTVRVQAIDTSGNTSLWTSADIITGSSSSPPPVPSTPVVLGVLGGLRITWDGLDHSGFPMPAFFDHVQVQRDTTSGFTSPSTVATLTGADWVYDSVQNYGSAYFYRLIAVSQTGFASAASATASGTALKAGTADLAANSVTANQIAAGSITAVAIAAGSIDATKMVISGVASNMLPDGGFEGAVGAAQVAAAGSSWSLDTTKFNGGAKSIKVNATFGSATTIELSLLSKVPAAPGDQFYLQTDWSATVLTGSTGVVQKIYIAWVNASGADISYGALQAPATLDGAWHTMSSTYTAPAGTVSCYVKLQIFNTTAVTAWYDNIIVRPVLGSTQIQGGSIKTAHLVATAIDGMTITGATLQTGTSGARTVMNSTGVHVYDSSGNVLDEVGGANGDIISYVPGSSGSYLKMGGAQLTWGDYNAGTSTITPTGASISSVSNLGPPNFPGQLILTSPNGGEDVPVRLQAFYQSGVGGTATGQATTPRMVLLETLQSAAADLYLSGNVIKCDSTGVAAGWQTPTVTATGFVSDTLRYRLTPTDGVRWTGNFHYTGSALTSASAFTIFATAVPAAYRTKTQRFFSVTNRTSTGVLKNTRVVMALNTDGTVSLYWSDAVGTSHDAAAIATGDLFSVDAEIPLGNLS
jgi:hypothetical protein